MKAIIMFLSIIFIIITFILIGSCNVSSDRDIIEQQFPDYKAELRTVLKSIIRDAETKNIEGLKAAHLASHKFTKFGPRNFYRQDLENANQSEAAFFSSISNYKQEIKDLKIDVFGELGIVTYHPQVNFIHEGQEKSVEGRQTFVFLRTSEGWKIVHEHSTPKW